MRRRADRAVSISVYLMGIKMSLSICKVIPQSDAFQLTRQLKKFGFARILMLLKLHSVRFCLSFPLIYKIPASQQPLH